MTNEPHSPSADVDQQLTRRIVARAQHEVKVRDLLSFAFARVWTIVLVLGAVLFAFSQPRERE